VESGAVITPERTERESSHGARWLSWLSGAVSALRRRLWLRSPAGCAARNDCSDHSPLRRRHRAADEMVLQRHSACPGRRRSLSLATSHCSAATYLPDAAITPASAAKGVAGAGDRHRLARGAGRVPLQTATYGHPPHLPTAQSPQRSLGVLMRAFSSYPPRQQPLSAAGRAERTVKRHPAAGHWLYTREHRAARDQRSLKGHRFPGPDRSA
jgi:hypothetical protein